jgi:hypothetical protein
MKILLCFLFSWYTSQIVQAELISLEEAVETNRIKVEYIASSERGIIHVTGCDSCTKSYYTFTGQPIILKAGTIVKFDYFLTDYWNARYPTLLLDPKTLEVLRIIY